MTYITDEVPVPPAPRVHIDAGRMLAVFSAYVALLVRDYERAHGDLPRGEVMRSLVKEAARVADRVEEACRG